MGGGQTAVHNGQLRTNSCENGRLVTLQVNHLISDNLLFQFLCARERGEGREGDEGGGGGEDYVCVSIYTLLDSR